MTVLLILCFIQGCLSAAIVPQASVCGQFCAEDYFPVCGTDGKTYSNQCLLDLASCNDPTIQKAHDGKCGSGLVGLACPQIICMALYDPVCGTDGKTYTNECLLEVASCHDTSKQVAHAGECGSTMADTLCPQGCFAVYSPVCGTDGITYSNSCELHSKHCNGDVTVAHHGPCIADPLSSQNN